VASQYNVLPVGEIKNTQRHYMVYVPFATTFAIVSPRHAWLEFRFEMNTEFGNRAAEVSNC